MEKKIASTIVREIKTKITEMKKKKPNASVYSLPLSMNSFGKDNNDICISIYNPWQYPRLAEHLTRYQAKRVAEEITKELNALKSTRGWSRLMWEYDDCCFDSRSWSDNYIKCPCNIILMAEPCKEYKSLSNYLSKYCGKALTETDIYSVGIGGKRGIVYGEEGNRYYLCHNSKKCEDLLGRLRKSRGTNDKVVCTKIKEEDDIDPWELQVSIRNEVEFSGVRMKYFEVSITSPSGRQKANIRIG